MCIEYYAAEVCAASKRASRVIQDGTYIFMVILISDIHI